MRILRNYLNSLNNAPFIPANPNPWYALYNSEVDDVFIDKQFGGLPLFSDNYETTFKLIRATINRNNYKWTKLYNTMIAQYDILNPYRMEISTEETIGETNTTMSYGSRTTTTNIGSRSGATTDYTVPFDSDSEVETGKSTSTSQQASDSEVVGARTDTIKGEEKVNGVESERKGNLGLKTTASILEEERRLAQFDLLKIIITDIVKEVVLPIFEDEQEWISYLTPAEGLVW